MCIAGMLFGHFCDIEKAFDKFAWCALKSTMTVR